MKLVIFNSITHLACLNKKQKLALAFGEIKASLTDIEEYMDSTDVKEHALTVIPFAAPLASAAMSFIISKIPVALEYAKSIGAKKVSKYLEEGGLGDKIIDAGSKYLKTRTKKLVEKFVKKGGDRGQLNEVAQAMTSMKKVSEKMKGLGANPDPTILKKLEKKLNKSRKILARHKVNNEPVVE